MGGSSPLPRYIGLGSLTWDLGLARLSLFRPRLPQYFLREWLLPFAVCSLFADSLCNHLGLAWRSLWPTQFTSILIRLVTLAYRHPLTKRRSGIRKNKTHRNKYQAESDTRPHCTAQRHSDWTAVVCWSLSDSHILAFIHCSYIIHVELVSHVFYLAFQTHRRCCQYLKAKIFGEECTCLLQNPSYFISSSFPWYTWCHLTTHLIRKLGELILVLNSITPSYYKD